MVFEFAGQMSDPPYTHLVPAILRTHFPKSKIDAPLSIS